MPVAPALVLAIVERIAKLHNGRLESCSGPRKWDSPLDFILPITG